MRLAAIDIGTNSIHMVIAESRGGVSFDVVDREREVVQIGRGSFASGRLRSAAIKRTVDALERFVRLARRHQVDRILCTATAAVREARNGGEFLAAARAACGIAPRVIPSDEEGRLVYLAVKSALQLDETPALLVDIGGGSAQLVVGNRERCLHTASVPLGALRLTERLLPNDPPTRRDLARLRRHVRRTLRPALAELAGFALTRAYGSSGTIHALAEIVAFSESGTTLQQLNGTRLSAEALSRFLSRLQRMDQTERERLPGIDASRAEILLPGAIVLFELLSMLGLDAITVSDFGVREGLVTDYLTFHAPEIRALEEVEDVRLRSVHALLARLGADGPHPRHVARLALALFDALREAHGLPDEARDLLHFAALLHDIGSVIGYDGHHEHSAYVIRHGNLRGLSAQEIERVALVARYHGKAQPRKRDPEIRALGKRARTEVRWLAAILRIAEGLERSHYQLIRSLRVVRRDASVSLVVSTKGAPQLELWAARRRVRLLERMLGTRVRVVLQSAAKTSEARAAGSALPLPPGSAPPPDAKPAGRGRPREARAPRAASASRGAAPRGSAPRGPAPRRAPVAPRATPAPPPPPASATSRLPGRSGVS
ncbi:MAG TPA: Ppx/GppA phosphatase family protein [Candidatus Saccharimonadaceae bacterium]|nr:Ppx/GppA phosphatase family protein [Candidatus Saccharimonadaceae bacterium]